LITFVTFIKSVLRTVLFSYKLRYDHADKFDIINELVEIIKMKTMIN